jgi:DNA-binding ferritin-like protein (Dps family)
LAEEPPGEALAIFAKTLFEVARVIQQEWQSIVAAMAPHLQQAMPTLASLARVDWKAVKQRLDALPQKSKDAMRLARSQGWFFGWHDGLQDVMELVENLVVKSSGTVDEIMVSYYRSNLQGFADQLTAAYAGREAPIKALSALICHRLMADTFCLFPSSSHKPTD